MTKPIIRKLGTLDCDMVETTPVVFRGRLYRFEYVRTGYHANKTGNSYFRFVDVETGKLTPSFAAGYHLGSAFVHDETAYVYGVDIWDGTEMRVFWSRDLNRWETKVAMSLPGWGLFNNSVCEGDDRFVMAFEIGRPPEETGVPFTNRFAESDDLLNWRLTPSECVYTKERYSACPAIRFHDGYYYMIYLETMPGPTYESHIVRSRDLVHWESSPLNPVLQHSDEDKVIANPALSSEHRERIANAVNVNSSDVDLCEYQGRTIINYSWGNQHGVEHLAQAEYGGGLVSFLTGFYPIPD